MILSEMVTCKLSKRIPQLVKEARRMSTGKLIIWRIVKVAKYKSVCQKCLQKVKVKVEKYKSVCQRSFAPCLPMVAQFMISFNVFVNRY